MCIDGCFVSAVFRFRAQLWKRSSIASSAKSSMRLRELTIAGLRGFNAERTVYFHDRLTLVAAPNSYGKTSVTEALEFLLYGETSKVEAARAKDEYKDSYRNRHYPADKVAFVEALFVVADGAETRLRVELDSSGTAKRFLDGAPVSQWPFVDALKGTARPFVVQHALKDLLLVEPGDRFKGFARLLGLNDVDLMQQQLVSLCTKPEANITSNAQKHLAALADLDATVGQVVGLAAIRRDLNGGVAKLDVLYRKVEARATAIVGTGRPDLIAALIAKRKESVDAVFDGDVEITTLSAQDALQLSTNRATLAASGGQKLLEAIGRLATSAALDRVHKEASLLGLGLELLREAQNVCPLCGQAIDNDIRSHITARHASAEGAVLGSGTRVDPRDAVGKLLNELYESLHQHHKLLVSRSGGLLRGSEDEAVKRIKVLLGDEHADPHKTIVEGAKLLKEAATSLAAVASEAVQHVSALAKAVTAKTESLPAAEDTAKAVQRYLSLADEYQARLDRLAPTLLAPASLLRQAIDKIAGTAELSALVRMLEKRISIERAMRIRDVLDGLKNLKKHVEQALAQTMETAFSAELTDAVMKWYSMIRTSGDPDVHFAGFAMAKTKSGDFKSKRVNVAARSYGVDLASAVSSLSESKLNALGLCVSIATAVRSPGPWGFILLDDPIQSWDQDHESQFIDIIRELILAEGKQVILLSHRSNWIKEVATGCRTLDGCKYEITGYTKDGPHIAERAWMPIEERLRDINAVANDPESTELGLQQAEEEVRIVVCELAACLAKRKLKRETSSHSLSAKSTRSILKDAGCDDRLIDDVTRTFETTDEAHHASKKWQPSAQRLRQYHGILLRLNAVASS